MKNYFKSALRAIFKDRSFSVINIIGLSIAFTVCILIFLWCKYELSYDKFNDNYDRIYRVNTEFHLSSEIERYASSPEPTGPTLVEEFPEITHTARFYRTSGLMVYGDKKFMEGNLVFTDPDALKMFDITAVKSDIETMLDDPYAIVLTRSMAEKYFGDEDPMGKVIRRNDSRDYTVSGVIEDFPENSSFNYDFLLSVNIFYELEVGFVGRWGNISGETYIMTIAGTDIDELNDKIWNVANEHSPDQKVCNLWLQPLSKIHLYDLDGGGSIQYIYIFAVIGIIVLLIACINFMNLSTARSSNRAKEVGMRKIGGATRKNLIRQFLGESVILAFMGLFIALIMLEFIIPFFEKFANVKVIFDWSRDLYLIPAVIAATLLTGLVAGSYPAFFLSSFDPLKTLKGVFTKGKEGSNFRKVLVLIQFSLSIALIVSTIVVYNQMDYLRNRELGFNKDNMLYLIQRGEVSEKFPEFKEELLKLKGVESVSRSGSTLDNIGYVASGLNWEGQEEGDDPIFCFDGIDYDYIETFELELIAGRSFSAEMVDDVNNYILNEAAVKRIGYEDPVGKPFTMWGREGKIIGVVKDFSYQAATEEIGPLLLTKIPDYYYYVHIKIDPRNTAGTVKEIKKIWKSFVTHYPIEYHFMDEDFEKMYKFEENMGTLFKIFSGLAVFIACLGLLGLSSFAVEHKIKEIGIRKVLGASVSGLLIHFIQDFTKWVLLANLIAWPLSYYAMSKWLQNYAFRIDLSVSTFIAATLLTLMISVITVFFHTFKAASSNPIEALKYE